MSRYYSRTVRPFQTSKTPLNSYNNTNSNVHYSKYSKYNNNNTSNNNQISYYNTTNNTSLNNPLSNYNNRTSINYKYQNNNNSTLTNTISHNNQTKNNNKTMTRYNTNNTTLYKSNDNFATNGRRNHGFFERVITNTNPSTNTNNNITRNSIRDININRNQNINEDKNKRYYEYTNDIKRHTYRTAKVPDYRPSTTFINRTQAINNRQQNNISKYPSFNSPINDRINNNLAKSQLMNKNDKNNNDKKYKIIYKTRYGSKISVDKDENINNEYPIRNSINQSINFENKLKNSFNNYENVNKSINNNIQNKNSLSNIENDNKYINKRSINKSINFDNKLKNSINNYENVNNSINNNIQYQNSLSNIENDNKIINKKSSNKSMSKSINNSINPNIKNDIENKNSFSDNEIVNYSNTNSNEIFIKGSNSNINTKELTKEQILFNVTNKLIGIMNLGNTCFINACLQILIHCPLFIYKLIKNLKLVNENTPITSNFLSICNIMANTEENDIDISNFKNIIGIKHVIYESYMQNDSQEFCRILLEDISRELNEIKDLSIYKLLSNSDRKTKRERDIDFHENFIQREKSFIVDLFYAQALTIFTCECKAEIYSFQKILDFPLLFPENKYNDVLSVYDLLKLYFKTEYIDFEVICERCKKKTKHKKEIKISRAPEILILSLQRIDEIKKKKLDYLVNFPLTLDIYEFMEHDCGYDKDCKYELFGIINHMGRINSGHYYSYIKLENKEWFEFNDSKVMQIDNLSDTSESAYALFYIKKKYCGKKFNI